MKRFTVTAAVLVFVLSMTGCTSSIVPANITMLATAQNMLSKCFFQVAIYNTSTGLGITGASVKINGTELPEQLPAGFYYYMPGADPATTPSGTLITIQVTSSVGNATASGVMPAQGAAPVYGDVSQFSPNSEFTLKY